MKTLLALVSLLAVVFALPAVAAPKKGKGPHPEASLEYRIVEVSPADIKVSLGKTGEEHIDYKITGATRVTLNGASVAARDLRAGMMARIFAGADHIAVSIEAKDPPAHPGKHRVG